MQQQTMRVVESQSAPILTARPDPRLMRLYFVSLLTLVAAVLLAGPVVPTTRDNTAQIILAYTLGIIIIIGAVWLWLQWIRLHNTVYTVTPEYVAIEQQQFLFGIARAERHLPVSNIQDVSVTHSMMQRLFGIGSVYLVASSGWVIAITDIRDADHVRDIIWDAVRKAVARKT
jgi:membrane protein YdbS with pleckstrin-like domain